MHLRALFGHSLKSPDVIQVLERFNMEVVYLFDRSGGSGADGYRASAHEDGFELYFDQNQRLDKVCMYASPQNEFSAIKPELLAARHYASFKEAENMFLGEGVAYFASPVETWIECKWHDWIIHYEFTAEGGLGVVTLMRASNS